MALQELRILRQERALEEAEAAAAAAQGKPGVQLHQSDGLLDELI